MREGRIEVRGLKGERKDGGKLSLHISLVARQVGAFPGFCSMK